MCILYWGLFMVTTFSGTVEIKKNPTEMMKIIVIFSLSCKIVSFVTTASYHGGEATNVTEMSE